MTRLRRLDWTGATQSARSELLRRSAVPDAAVRATAAAVCDDVAARGAAAVAEYAERFGGGFRRIGGEELTRAADALPDDVRAAIQASAAAVERYHRTQVPVDSTTETHPGVTIERRWSPLTRVGCYVPGGKAAYPSTVVMTVVPARVAGVESVVVVSPADEAGNVDPTLAGTCALLGVDEVWAIGGAQAVAALAHGAGDLLAVQKIVGPGNSYVTAAKLAVYGTAAIDLPAGPSEVLVMADSTADPFLVAADLLCQAEHGPDSPAILVTDDPTLADRVETALDTLLGQVGRAHILEQALTEHGTAVIVDGLDTMIEIANGYAGEHVTVLTADPTATAGRITAAGSVYVGRWSPESAGDYATGANHVLPTGGLAAACGPLAVEDFGAWAQIQTLSREGLESLLPTITHLAGAEGLDAHALAARIRFERSEYQ
ncbi:MAG TPA: histidinol dehydrogenase [Acidimicrobiia bacterium]|nr:histidinol dehydrogenase [Acidimicrobiia bacterium]